MRIATRSTPIDPRVVDVRRPLGAPLVDHLPARPQGRRPIWSCSRDAIEPNLADRDFFIRKAIGWALREYAKADPQWVRDVVAAREDRLAPLSRREALKHLG